jgi:peptidoglycan/xylan/chitin deacetylase (PgdA/CDA1 family)
VPLPVGPAVIVLGYHHVCDDLPGGVHPRDFREQVTWLRSDSGIDVLSLEAAKQRLHARGALRAAVLTFDDALNDFYAGAFPVLSTAGIPATLFVPVTLLGTHGYMTRAQVQEVARSGVDVGGHSRRHVDLRGCTDRELEREVRGCREELEDLLAVRVRSFAYPAGFYNERVARAVHDAGYSIAVTTHRGWWRRRTDPMQVPRSFIEDMPLPTFKAATKGGLHVLALADRIRGLERLGSAQPPAES